MHIDQSRSLKKLSLAACAMAVAATVGGAHAEDEPAALQSIQKYCATSWRNAGITQQDWPDCTQETMTLLLERLSRARLPQAIHDHRSPERRELNRSIWCTIQRWRRGPKHVSLEHPETVHRDAQERSNDVGEQLDDAMAAADRCLTARQQRILALSREGWTVGEIARKLKMTPARTSDEKYKAIRKLQRHLGVAS